MGIDFVDLITEAERTLSSGDVRGARRLLYRMRRVAGRARVEVSSLQADVDR